MKKAEVAKVAAKWWADQLTADEMPESGVFELNNMVLWARCQIAPPTDDQLVRFQQVLEEKILDDLENNDTGWADDDPMRGAALRTIGVDYHPDRILKEAADETEINVLLLPIKTNMWINPDGVKVSGGYKGAIEALE
jgi:hypothetical protein